MPIVFEKSAKGKYDVISNTRQKKNFPGNMNIDIFIPHRFADEDTKYSSHIPIGCMRALWNDQAFI